MRRTPFAVLVAAAAAISLSTAVPVEPDVAELNFDTRLSTPSGLAAANEPAWLASVEQQGGAFLDNPAGWQVGRAAPRGAGRLSITIDRKLMVADLVATILFDADNSADLAVQLFDAQGRVVVVDLFGNLVDVGKDLATNTVVIPLRKYPTAVKIVLRRIQGAINVRGVVLYPVATEGEAVEAEMQKLASVLGDPLSPENPLAKSLQAVAKNAKATINPIVTSIPIPSPQPVITHSKNESGLYPAAIITPKSDQQPPLDGLVGHWSFDGADPGADSGPLRMDGHGAFGNSQGVRGKALHLNAKVSESVSVAHSPALDLKDALTVSAWIRYSRLAPVWGSQIVWYGDTHLGCDPWDLHLLRNGHLEFRSDRTVTGKPVFTVFDNEIRLSPKGEKVLDQHVTVTSPQALARDTWYFVAGTIEKISPQTCSMKLYVNGELVDETRTAEVVEYDTSKMWLEIGGVDLGNWQNFDGSIDEVRIYNRALAPAELVALYDQVR